MARLLVKYTAFVAGKKYRGLIWTEYTNQLNERILQHINDTKYTKNGLSSLSFSQLQDATCQSSIIPSLK